MKQLVLVYKDYMETLKTLKEIEGVKKAIITEANGSPMTQPTRDRKTAIIGSALSNVANFAHQAMFDDFPETVITSSKKGMLIVAAIGEEYLLVVTVEPTANQQLISVEITRAINRIMENAGGKNGTKI